MLSQGDDSSPTRRARSPPPPLLTDFLCQSLAPYKNFLKAAHVNAQSLLCHIDEFREIFDTTLFDIILISETWLKPHITYASISLLDYNIYRNDRLYKGGGGVAAYVRSSLPTSILFSSDTSREARPEFMLLDVNVSGSHVLVCVCYRAPNIGHMYEFELALLETMSRYSHVIVMGDFNTNLLGPDTHDRTYLTTMFRSCNLTLLPLDATHHTAAADTWLDLIAVGDPSLVAHHGQHSAPGLSKHDLIFCACKLLPPKSKPKILCYRNYKALNYENLFLDMSVVPWHEVILSNSVDSMVYKFNKHLVQLLNKHVPLVKKRITRPPAPWLTDGIRQLQKQRDSAFRKSKRTKSLEDWNAYKLLRNRTQQQIRNAKVRFYHCSLSKRQSTKSLWTKLKNLGVGKSNNDTSVPIDLDTINNFFVNTPVDQSGAHDFVTELEADAPHHAPDRRFWFTPITDSDVLKTILHMSSNAVGADNIPIRFLKCTLSYTLPVITAIVNKSLSTSVFPTAWKSALVLPLPKTSSSTPSSPSDYRPISILPAISKCMERIVHQQISQFLYNNNNVYAFQSGYRPLHSTSTALLKLTDDIRLAMDSRRLTILTLFDFSKAFDCVYHPLLLIKLKQNGFSNDCIEWVRSYLSDRRQCVKVGDSASSWRPVTRGVPQGSVLGPLLFTIYINDVTNALHYSKYHLYADDLQIYKHFTPREINLNISHINSDIDSISRWAFRHGLKLNEGKTQVLMIGSSRLRSNVDLNSCPRLRLNGKELQYSDNVKNLGLTINKTLSWTEHVTATCNRVFASIHSLKRFSLFLPLNIKVMLVKTLVLPHFNYCDTVINDMTVELSDRLQRAQNYCVRFIFNLRRQDHVSPYFGTLNIMKLHHLRSYHILLLLYSVLKNKSPVYLSDNFRFLSDVSERQTRGGSALLSIPIHHSIFYNKSFTVTACRLWNNLPNDIKTIDKRARFGVRVKDFLLRG